MSFVPHHTEYRHTDIGGNRLLIGTDVMPGNAPAVFFRTNAKGSSVPVKDLPALIAQLQVIADAATAECEAKR